MCNFLQQKQNIEAFFPLLQLLFLIKLILICPIEVPQFCLKPSIPLSSSKLSNYNTRIRPVSSWFVLQICLLGSMPTHSALSFLAKWSVATYLQSLTLSFQRQPSYFPFFLLKIREGFLSANLCCSAHLLLLPLHSPLLPRLPLLRW